MKTLNKASFNFFYGLNDFFKPAKRDKVIWAAFNGSPAVKDTLESLGVPHPEVGSIMLNGEIVSFEQQITNGDQVDVYPANWKLNSSTEYPLQPESPDNLRFVLDVHLGKLARIMRMLGIDTLYDSAYDDPQITEIGCREQRFILTRDIDLLKQTKIKYGHWMRNTDPINQTDEILLTFDVYSQMDPFTRCLSCNGMLRPVAKEKVADQLPPGVKKYYEKYHQCDRCQKVYWKGSHYEHMSEWLRKYYGIMEHGA
ncbi:MAG TPA: Mut7-C RNAse domain-containing protein [Balneolales bacterium]|nr:Mut7-C RNAse domain-containing protein [Balneolales bacterium]